VKKLPKVKMKLPKAKLPNPPIKWGGKLKNLRKGGKRR